jgi:hypothetical protein
MNDGKKKAAFGEEKYLFDRKFCFSRSGTKIFLFIYFLLKMYIFE